MHHIAEVDAWNANVHAVDDGDAGTAANIEAGTQDLANRTLFLANRTPGVGASVQLIAAFGELRQLAARFEWTGYTYLNIDTADAGGLSLPVVNMPQTGTIVGFTAYVTGLATAGAHGGLLGNAPYIVLVRGVLAPQSNTDISTATDPYATTNLALYETEHTIVSGALAEVITPLTKYRFDIHGEAGANKANSKFDLYGIVLTITP